MRHTELHYYSFPKGKEHDAYVEIRNLIRSANIEVVIVDSYVDDSLFNLLGSIEKRKLTIRILISKIPSDFNLEANKFVKQYPQHSLHIRKVRDFHDRFIVIDGKKFYHLGASIKDAGKQAFMLNKLEDQSNIEPLINQIENSWNDGVDLIG